MNFRKERWKREIKREQFACEGKLSREKVSYWGSVGREEVGKREEREKWESLVAGKET